MKDTNRKKQNRNGSILDKTLNRKIFIIVTLMFPIIHFLIFWLYVNIDGIFLAFKDARTEEWTLNNFKTIYELLTVPGGELKIALRNTFLYFGESFVLLFLNLVVAYFLYKKVLFHKAYRIIFYIPGIISGVALSTVFTEFIRTQGPLGIIMKSVFNVTLPETGLLGSAATATYTMMAYNVWIGFSGWVLMFTASLARIPEEVIESAKLEGCSPFRELISIVWPLIMPMFTTLFILNFTTIFSASGPILLFTQGQFETTTLSYWSFTQIYGSGGYGGTGAYGLVSAMGIITTLIAVPLTLLVRSLTDKIPAVEY